MRAVGNMAGTGCCRGPFPSDVEAGRITAELMAEQLAVNPHFQTDFAAAKAELRGALGLAP